MQDCVDAGLQSGSLHLTCLCEALIKKAGVRDARLHDGRHTAATTLLLLGVSERAVIDIMGRSTGKMTLVCQHITDGVRRDVAGRSVTTSGARTAARTR